MVAKTGLASRVSVLENIQEKYEIDAETAQKALVYDYTFRGRMNRMHATAMVAESFQMHDGVASEVVGAAKEVVSAIPVFGSIAGLVGYGVHRATQAVERHYKMGEAANVLKMNPAADPTEWAQAMSDISEGVIRQKVRRFSGMSAEEVKAMAEKDTKVVATAIMGGKIPGTIYNPDTVETLVYMAQEPSKDMKPVSAEKMKEPEQVHSH